MTINEFRALFRTHGHPLAQVLFACDETTGKQIGNPAWDDPKNLTYLEAQNADRMA